MICCTLLYSISKNFSSIFICIFFIDLEHKIILDRFQIALLVLGVASIFFDKDASWGSHIIGGLAGFVVFYLISWGFEITRHKEGLGGGDVKLAGVVGLLLGWERLLLGLLIATIPAAKKERKENSPLHPSLSSALAFRCSLEAVSLVGIYPCLEYERKRGKGLCQHIST